LIKILCAFGEYSYGVKERGVSYEYNNFIQAFNKIGFEVDFIDIWDKSKYVDFFELNKCLIEKINSFKPDILFCVPMNYEIWTETLEIIKNNTNILTVHWSTDDSWKYDQVTKFISPFYDVCFTTYKSAIEKAKKDGGGENFILSQWAANSDNLIHPKSAQQCKYKVTFIGAAYGNRKKWIRQLNERGVKVDCFGYGWPNGVIKSEEIPVIVNQSVISLNFGDSGIVFDDYILTRSRQIKARVFEVPGSGGFLITETADQLNNYYNVGKEIIVYIDIGDLASKIQYYLNNMDKRDVIANASFEKTKNQHTYEIRFNEILKLAYDRKNRSKLQTCAIDINSFLKLKKQHNINIMLILLRSFIKLPCILLFGRRRGPRLARRLIYEISWRFFGRSAYSVKGLTGRLFYKQS
jgi:spore maturation protein CgeB